jgi:solute carrier family 45 protein 1/2/4
MVCGVPWAISCWAPFSIMGEEINSLGIRTDEASQYTTLDPDELDEENLRTSSEAVEDDIIYVAHDDEDVNSSTGELAGLYLGVLNIFTTLPQFVSTLISSIIFAILAPGKSPELAPDIPPGENYRGDGPNAIAVCLAVGSLSSLVAARLAWNLRNSST